MANLWYVCYMLSVSMYIYRQVASKAAALTALAAVKLKKFCPTRYTTRKPHKILSQTQICRKSTLNAYLNSL